MLLGQFSVTFEYRPGAQHANSDGMSRQCGQCMRPGCPVSSPHSRVDDGGSTSVLLDQPFASSEMGDSMDADLMPDLSGKTWVAATLSDELTADLPLAGSDLDLIASQLVVPVRERQDMIGRFHDSLFVGHLGVSRTAYRLLDRAYWPGLPQDVRTCLASCAVCLTRKSPCPRRAPMGHVDVGHRWDRVAIDLLVSYNPERQPVRPGFGGLFFSMDGSLPAA